MFISYISAQAIIHNLLLLYTLLMVVDENNLHSYFVKEKQISYLCKVA